MKTRAVVMSQDAWRAWEELAQATGHVYAADPAEPSALAPTLHELLEAIGLLHDFDWEIHPNLNEHPMQGAPILRGRGWDEEIIRVILSHYEEGTGVPRSQPVDFALLACDEITGLILATALVRPNRNLHDVALSSIQKKWKNRQFAAGVDREHVAAVTADFSRVAFDGQLDLWTHIANVLAAMQTIADQLGLDGAPPA